MKKEIQHEKIKIKKTSCDQTDYTYQGIGSGFWLKRKAEFLSHPQ